MKKKFLEFLKGKEISEEDYKKKTAEEMADLYNEFNEAQNKALESAIEGKASKDDIKTLKEEIAESVKKQGEIIFDAMKEHTLAVKKMTEKAAPKTNSLMDEIAEKKEDIMAIAKGTKREIELKALTTRAAITNNEQAIDLVDIGQLQTDKLSAIDIFPKIPITGSNHNGTIRYYDWNEATTVRAAAMVAEGAAFPESTAKWARFNTPIRKIGDTLPVTEEFFEDEAMFAAELNMFLNTNVQIEANDQVINGDGTGENLTGLFTSSPAFTAVASGITDASIYDLIVKVSEDITDGGGKKYIPNFALMNISDINKMKLKKDGNNNYIMPPFVSRDGSVVSGITIVEDNAVTANTMEVGDTRFGRIYEMAGMAISVGFVGTQFTEDEMTLKIRKRMAFLIRNVDRTGFRSVASISAALTTLATP